MCALKKELRPNAVAPTTTYGMGRNPFQRTLSQCNGSNIGGTSTTTAPFSSLSVEFKICSAGSGGDDVGNSSNTSISGNGSSPGFKEIAEGSTEMQKIKKVQSFFRGWLCRRRWKQIVEQYIKSPHAESMRKRNR